MSTTFIKINNATFRHRNDSFYENFNWTVQKGEHWVITGNVSAGKTSLVHALSGKYYVCLLYTSPSPRDLSTSRMPSSA